MGGKARWRKLRRVSGMLPLGANAPGKQRFKKDRIKIRDAKYALLEEGQEDMIVDGAPVNEEGFRTRNKGKIIQHERQAKQQEHKRCIKNYTYLNNTINHIKSIYNDSVIPSSYSGSENVHILSDLSARPYNEIMISPKLSATSIENYTQDETGCHVDKFIVNISTKNEYNVLDGYSFNDNINNGDFSEGSLFSADRTQYYYKEDCLKINDVEMMPDYRLEGLPCTTPTEGSDNTVYDSKNNSNDEDVPLNMNSWSGSQDDFLETDINDCQATETSSLNSQYYFGQSESKNQFDNYPISCETDLNQYQATENISLNSQYFYGQSESMNTSEDFTTSYEWINFCHQQEMIGGLQVKENLEDIQTMFFSLYPQYLPVENKYIPGCIKNESDVYSSENCDVQFFCKAEQYQNEGKNKIILNEKSQEKWTGNLHRENIHTQENSFFRENTEEEFMGEKNMSEHEGSMTKFEKNIIFKNNYEIPNEQSREFSEELYSEHEFRGDNSSFDITEPYPRHEFLEEFTPEPKYYYNTRYINEFERNDEDQRISEKQEYKDDTEYTEEKEKYVIGNSDKSQPTSNSSSLTMRNVHVPTYEPQRGYINDLISYEQNSLVCQSGAGRSQSSGDSKETSCIELETNSNSQCDVYSPRGKQSRKEAIEQLRGNGIHSEDNESNKHLNVYNDRNNANGKTYGEANMEWHQTGDHGEYIDKYEELERDECETTQRYWTPTGYYNSNTEEKQYQDGSYGEEGTNSGVKETIFKSSIIEVVDDQNKDTYMESREGEYEQIQSKEDYQEREKIEDQIEHGNHGGKYEQEEHFSKNTSDPIYYKSEKGSHAFKCQIKEHEYIIDQEPYVDNGTNEQTRTNNKDKSESMYNEKDKHGNITIHGLTRRSTFTEELSCNTYEGPRIGENHEEKIIKFGEDDLEREITSNMRS